MNRKIDDFSMDTVPATGGHPRASSMWNDRARCAKCRALSDFPRNVLKRPGLFTLVTPDQNVLASTNAPAINVRLPVPDVRSSVPSFADWDRKRKNDATKHVVKIVAYYGIYLTGFFFSDRNLLVFLERIFRR